jgi:hypothetical protein
MMLEYVFENCGIYPVELEIIDQEKTIQKVTEIIRVEDTIDLPVILNVVGGFGCAVQIKAADEPVICEIRINGPLVIGSIISEQIPAGSVKMVDLGFILGFGPVDIMVSINEITKTYDAFMIGPFVVHLQ